MQRVNHLPDRQLPRRRVHNQLGHDRIIVDRDLRPLLDPGIDTDPRSHRLRVMENSAGRGQETVLAVLGVYAALDRVPPLGQLPEGVGHRLPRGNSDLFHDQVDPRHHLGDRMFHLNARVHLQKIVVPRFIQQELHRPSVDIAGGLRHFHRIRPHLRSQLRRDCDRGRFLDNLLVSPLDRAFPLEQVHARAVGVRQHLKLDMARIRDIFLQVHRVVTERVRRLAPRSV